MIIGLQVRLGDHVFDTRYKKLSVAGTVTVTVLCTVCYDCVLQRTARAVLLCNAMHCARIFELFSHLILVGWCFVIDCAVQTGRWLSNRSSVRRK
jgi:hypothetical protein